MADYCTLAHVKAVGNITDTSDDALLAALITRASAMVDSYTRRRFYERTETRYYTPGVDSTYQTLYLDEDLLSITTLTNGDGAVIPAAGYTLEPLNYTPKTRVTLNTAYSWAYAAENQIGVVSITGSWGYCTAANCPADIVHAACRLTVWLYKQRDTAFGKAGNTITGDFEIPVTMPMDVHRVLNLYRRPIFEGM